ncbi:MAG: sigma 54-interacting transcriptional regulator, partial [Acidobacteriota bacterium]|nr:sigma 54-interacting transcriptional regulator [Acidobacteriota bacterium]
AEEQLELCYRHARLVEVNEAFAEVYQTPRQEIAGHWGMENFLPRSLPTSEPFMLRVIRAGYVLVNDESVERTQEGLDLAFLNSTTPTIENGELVWVWGVSRDITELRATETELRLRQGELERLRERLEAENVYLREELREGLHFGDIVGESEPWRNVITQVKLVAKTESTVLLHGETGTGKELLARALLAESPRRDHPLIKVNCAALPSTLIESELFGHEKGAFSGADRQRLGRFELADGGTLFLDEIGELPLELQAKLLNVLQTGEFERLGSSKTRVSDARVIAATNRDLRKEVEEGRFRSDLYYRLAVFPIEVPPLRDRRDDIPLLTMYFLSLLSVKHTKSIDRISKQTMARFVEYDWPGNVRELENLIERAVILSSGSTLNFDTAMLGPTAPIPVADASPPEKSAAPPAAVAAPASASLREVERLHITAVLEACDWKVKGAGNAAERLGLKESTLRSRMKKRGIERPRV